MVKNERQRVSITTAKELNAIIQQVKGQLIKTKDFQSRKFYNSANQQRPYSISYNRPSEERSIKTAQIKLEKHKSIAEAIQRKRESELKFRQKQRENVILKRKGQLKQEQKFKTLIRGIENEKKYDKKVLVKRRDDYKKTRILEHIKMEDQRSFILQKQKQDLSKLRQDMRKTASFIKYQAKSKLEKLKTDFYVTFI